MTTPGHHLTPYGNSTQVACDVAEQLASGNAVPGGSQTFCEFCGADITDLIAQRDQVD
jgi:hypothetical protein